MLSVIVPVYNVERYLDRCVESLLAQEYQDLDILLVDDGSTDDSATICDVWSFKDNRVRVIHQQNAGLSGARNAGLLHARGEWVTFVDSDDYIYPQCYSQVMKCLADSGCDVGMFGMVCERENGTESQLAQFEQGKIYTHEEVMEQVVLSLQTAVTNKIFRRELIGDIRFPEGLIHGEDLVFFLQVLQPETKFVSCDTIGYRYIKRKGSITTKGFNPRSLDEITCKDLAQQLMQEKFPAYAARALRWCFMARLNIAHKLLLTRERKLKLLHVSCVKWLAANYSHCSHLLPYKVRAYTLFLRILVFFTNACQKHLK